MKLTNGQQQAVSILYSFSQCYFGVFFFFFLDCLAIVSQLSGSKYWPSHLTEEPPEGDGNWLSLGQIPAGHAELSVSLGHLISNKIHLQPGFLASCGIILSIAMQQSGKTLYRCFCDPMPSTWASFIGLYCMCCSGLPHWEFYEFHKEGICF